MTGNQINYQRFLEDQRHNYVTEANQIRQITELERHNSITESQGWSQLLETERHNKAGESLGWAQFNESQRHNLVSENLGYLSYAETKRHNVAGEQYNMSYLQELSRHNRASEQVDWYNAETRYLSYLESNRHNLADEALGYAKNPWAYLTNPEKARELVSSFRGAVTGLQDDVGITELNERSGSWYDNMANRFSNWLLGYHTNSQGIQHSGSGGNW